MVLIDTIYRRALGNPKDKSHQLALRIGRKLQEDPDTTWLVIAETSHILQREIGPMATLSVL